MYIESSEMCNKITFNLAQGINVDRRWEIKVLLIIVLVITVLKVLQYDSKQDMRFLAPPGCLQYHTGSGNGIIQNFNYQDKTSTHLSRYKDTRN